MKTTTCTTCTQPFSYDPVFLEDREIFEQVTCPSCIAVAGMAEKERAAAERHAKMDERWARICPPQYDDTDTARLPRPYQIIIQSWKFGCKGLGLQGAAGKGKTRTAFCILKKQHFMGRKCAAISAKRLGKLALDMFDSSSAVKAAARNTIARCQGAEILLLDDLGKGRMTERPEEELYDLLEYRTSHRLPTFWTSEHAGEMLRASLSDERGPAIMRRLDQFSEIL